MYCSNCGKETDTEDKYCKYCGKKLLKDNNKNNETEIEEKDSTSSISMKYLNFFAKWYLPFVVIVNFIIICGNFNFNNEIDTTLLCTFILYLILYIAIPIKLISGIEKKEKFGFFLLISFFILDYLIKLIVGINMYLQTNIIDEYFIIYTFILLLIYAIWYIPNIIYFAKRKKVFTN